MCAQSFSLWRWSQRNECEPRAELSVVTRWEHQFAVRFRPPAWELVFEATFYPDRYQQPATRGAPAASSR